MPRQQSYRFSIRTSLTKKHFKSVIGTQYNGLQGQINEHQAVTGGMFNCRNGASFQRFCIQ
jgi:hypothetical protein